MSSRAQDDVIHRLVTVAHRSPRGQVDAACEILLQIPAGSTAATIESHLGSAISPNARQLLAFAATDWIRATGDETFERLAFILRGAAAADQWWRDTRTIDLVWTGPSEVSGVLRRTHEALLQVVREARSELWLVTFAGYKVPAIRDALVAAAARGVRLDIVIESPEISNGKVTFSALEGIGGNLASVSRVWVWPLDRRTVDVQGKHGTLHAKCAVADGSLLFVSSANLTEHAMTVNMELGLFVRGGPAPRDTASHFRWLVESGNLVPASRA